MWKMMIVLMLHLIVTHVNAKHTNCYFQKMMKNVQTKNNIIVSFIIDKISVGLLWESSGAGIPLINVQLQYSSLRIECADRVKKETVQSLCGCSQCLGEKLQLNVTFNGSAIEYSCNGMAPVLGSCTNWPIISTKHPTVPKYKIGRNVCGEVVLQDVPDVCFCDIQLNNGNDLSDNERMSISDANCKQMCNMNAKKLPVSVLPVEKLPNDAAILLSILCTCLFFIFIISVFIFGVRRNCGPFVRLDRMIFGDFLNVAVPENEEGAIGDWKLSFLNNEIYNSKPMVVDFLNVRAPENEEGAIGDLEIIFSK